MRRIACAMEYPRDRILHSPYYTEPVSQGILSPNTVYYASALEREQREREQRIVHEY